MIVSVMEQVRLGMGVRLRYYNEAGGSDGWRDRSYMVVLILLGKMNKAREMLGSSRRFYLAKMIALARDVRDQPFYYIRGSSKGGLETKSLVSMALSRWILVT